MSVPERLPEAGRRFALIELDATVLLLPQQDLRAIEPILDVAPDSASGFAAAQIRLRSGRWPVLCLSDDLEPLAQLLPQRRICAMLAVGPKMFGVACSNVNSVTANQVTLFPVPQCMRVPASPVRDLGLWDGRIACVTSAERLYAGLGLSLPVGAGANAESNNEFSFA